MKALGYMDDVYNSKNPFVSWIMNKRLDVIAEMILKTPKIRKVLDAGCGEGHLLSKLSAYIQGYGIDFDERFIRAARKRCPYANFKKEDITNMKFRDNVFDVVVCTEVIEHIENPEKAIEEMKRVLKPDGILIISFPNESLTTLLRFLLRRKPVKNPEHLNSFSPADIKRLVGMELAEQINLPLRFIPFALSQLSIMKFRSEE